LLHKKCKQGLSSPGVSSLLKFFTHRALKTRLNKEKNNVTDRQEGKEISLTTSRINYIDPRITFAWCKGELQRDHGLISHTDALIFLEFGIDQKKREYSGLVALSIPHADFDPQSFQKPSSRNLNGQRT
jgi:hypothetical protein